MILHRLKPKSKAKTQLLLAGTMWFTVGIILYIRALRWLFANHYGSMTILLSIGGATIVGLIKGKMALDRAAQRAITRIATRGDGTCLFGFFSYKSWLLILLMITMGKLLRMSPAPIILVSTLYMAIGTALSFSSRSFFTACRVAYT